MEDVRRTRNFKENGIKVGDRIVKYLRLVHITQEDIAKKCFPDVKVQLVNRRLKGVVDLSISEYMAICDYLNVAYDTFLNEERYAVTMYSTGEERRK